MIFIRGPPLTGKHFLAKKIIEREESHHNSNYKHITGEKLYRRRNEKEYNGSDLIYDEFREAIKELKSPIIVELKHAKCEMLFKYTDIANERNYALFGIELFIDNDSSLFKIKAQQFRRSYQKRVREYLNDMRSYPTPCDVTPLDPLDLYEKEYRISQYLSNVTDKNNYQKLAYCKDDIDIVGEFIKRLTNDSGMWTMFPQGLEHSVNLSDDLIDIVANMINEFKMQPRKSVLDIYFSKFYSFEFNKSIEYNHRHKMTFEEEIREFKIPKVYDHNHRTGQALTNMIYDIDLDEIIDTIKTKIKEENFERNLKENSENINHDSSDSTSVYPNNWELVEHERPIKCGKRKKHKTKKILRLLNQNAVKSVQKRVKRLKLDEELMKEVEEAMEMDENESQNHHIVELMSKTYLNDVANDQKTEFFEYIKTFYERLEKIPEISLVLQLVSQSDLLRITFDIANEIACENFKSHQIAVVTRNKTEVEMLTSLANQFMKCAILITYANSGKPYHKNDEDRKDEIERILFDIECKATENHESITKMFSQYDERTWEVEIICVIAKIIVVEPKDVLIKNYDKLWDFFKRTLNDMEKNLKKFYNSSRLSVF